jgi:hypothetical protein
LYLVKVEKFGKSMLDGIVKLGLGTNALRSAFDFEMCKVGYSSVLATPGTSKASLQLLIERQLYKRYVTAYSTGISIHAYPICEGGDARQRELAFFEDKTTAAKMRLIPAEAPVSKGEGEGIQGYPAKTFHRTRLGETLMCRTEDFPEVLKVLCKYATDS